MPKHSRAPWRVKPVKGQAPYIVDADGLAIGMAMHWTGSENNPLPNAHMFAAAPDLLAACKEASDAIDELLHHAEYMPGIFQASERARQACLAAIARAKGADNGN